MKKLWFIILVLIAQSGYSQSILKIDSVKRMLLRNEKQITQGLLAQAFDTCLRMERLFSEINSQDTLVLVQTYMQKANIQYLRYEYLDAETNYRQCRILLERNNYKSHRVYLICLDRLALVYRKSGYFNQSRKEYENLLTIKKVISQKEDSSFAVTLGDLALLYLDYAYYDKVKETLDSALHLHKQVFEPDHLLLANVYNNLGLYHQRISNFTKSENFFLEALRIRKAKVGFMNSSFITTQLNLSKLYLENGKYSKADSLMKRVVSARVETVGKNHIFYVTAILQQAKLKSETGFLKSADKLNKEAIGILEFLYPKTHQFYIQSQINLANVQKDLGNYKECIEILKECEKLISTKKSVSPKDYTDIHFELAKIFHQVGQLEKSEEYYSLSKTEFISLYGAGSTYFAEQLSHAGMLYNELGNYSATMDCFREAQSIWLQSGLEASEQYADLLKNWAIIELQNNKLDKAKSLITNALGIYNTTANQIHPKIAFCNSVLGQIMLAENKLDSAVKYFENSLAQYKINFLSSHLNALNIQLAYVNLLLRMDSIGRALEYIQSGLVMLSADFVSSHLMRAQFLLQYADLFYKQNNIKSSDSCFILALQTLKDNEEVSFSTYLIALREYIQFNESIKNYEATEKLLSELASAHTKKLSRIILHLTPNELTDYTEKYYGDLALFNQIVMNRTWNGISLGQLPAIGYNFLLFYKGFLLQSATQLNQAVGQLQENDSLLTELKLCHHYILKEYEQTRIDRKEISVLEKRKNKIEKLLIKKLSKQWTVSQTINWKDVQAKLSKDETAIEFVNPKMNFPNSSSKSFYAAIMIKPDYKVPKFIFLCNVSSLDSLMAFNSERKADYANSLYSIDDRGAIEIVEKKSSLSQLIYDPLRTELEGVKTIYYAPSGLLHRINLEAIPVNKILSNHEHCDQTIALADMFKFVRLNNTRQLVIGNSSEKPIGQAFLFGGVDYDNTSSTVHFQSDSLNINYKEDKSNNKNLKIWTPLPTTVKEINTIEQLCQGASIPVSVHKGVFATEERFKRYDNRNITAPAFFHFGTHGYFFSDETKSDDSLESEDHFLHDLSDSIAPMEVLNLSDKRESVFKISNQPMLRSGLILAGGNEGWYADNSQDKKDDGILTAYEISQMNLSRTELVVLAACETGLGDILDNEGVYGLQRAFKIAGVKYIIMSLWQVPDKQTNLLMSIFYKKWIENKMSIPDAFRIAQKEMREMGLDPYHWAGFVLVE